MLRQVLAQLRERQILVRTVELDLAHRHCFDERHVHAAAMGPADQFGNFVIVEILQRDCIDLDADTGALCGFNTLKNPGKIAPAGDLVEFFRIERIQRDIDTAHAAFRQLVGKA